MPASHYERSTATRLARLVAEADGHLETMDSDLRAELGIESQRTLRNALQHLESLDLITYTRHTPGCGGHSRREPRKITGDPAQLAAYAEEAA